MKFPEWLKVYGDQSFRDKKCYKEGMEQATFFNRLRSEYPEIAKISSNVKNEGKRSNHQYMRDSSQGLTKGISDIFIAGSPTFICELKRRDHTLSQWKDGQQEFMKTAQEYGAFVVLALGADEAWKAFHDWLEIVNKNKS